MTIFNRLLANECLTTGVLSFDLMSSFAVGTRSLKGTRRALRSKMLFTEKHISMVLSGKKTQTRRRWDSPQVKVGNSYRATTDLFTPRAEAPAYIEIVDLRTEPLGEIDTTDAAAEGGYSVDEFVDLWTEMHGEWNPDEEVWVIDFVGHETDPRQG